eukprot:jgi/Mesvir1/14494/Mv05195-RA.1
MQPNAMYGREMYRHTWLINIVCCIFLSTQAVYGGALVRPEAHKQAPAVAAKGTPAGPPRAVRGSSTAAPAPPFKTDLPADYIKYLDLDFRPWAQPIPVKGRTAGIRQRSLPSCKLGSCINVKILNNQLYWSRPRSHDAAAKAGPDGSVVNADSKFVSEGLSYRDCFQLLGFLDLLRVKRSVPDVEFAINSADEPMYRTRDYATTTVIPFVFSTQKSNEYLDVLLPPWSTWGVHYIPGEDKHTKTGISAGLTDTAWEVHFKELVHAREQNPFAFREPKAFFRDSIGDGSNLFRVKLGLCHGSDEVDARFYADSLHAAASNQHLLENYPELARQLRHFETGPPVHAQHRCQYKYLLYMDADDGGVSPDMPDILTAGAVVLAIKSGKRETYYSRTLRDREHVVYLTGVPNDVCDDIEDAVQFGEQNHTDSSRMAQRLHSWAESHLSPSAILEYMRVALHKYSQLQKWTPVLDKKRDMLVTAASLGDFYAGADKDTLQRAVDCYRTVGRDRRTCHTNLKHGGASGPGVQDGGLTMERPVQRLLLPGSTRPWHSDGRQIDTDEGEDGEIMGVEVEGVDDGAHRHHHQQQQHAVKPQEEAGAEPTVVPEEAEAEQEQEQEQAPADEATEEEAAPVPKKGQPAPTKGSATAATPAKTGTPALAPETKTSKPAGKPRTPSPRRQANSILKQREAIKQAALQASRQRLAMGGHQHAPEGKPAMSVAKDWLTKKVEDVTKHLTASKPQDEGGGVIQTPYGLLIPAEDLPLPE